MKKEWTSWRNSNFDFFKKMLTNMSRNLVLYDLGSGPEQFSEVFGQFKYTPVDVERFNENTVVADLTKIFPFQDGVADIVTLSNTLEHILNPEHFVSECARILKSGGKIIGTVPFLLGEHQVPYDFNRYTHFHESNKNVV